MEEEIKTMSYKQFKAWCNLRACDGSWNSIDEAITCLQVIKEIDSIKVKGLFKKKATLKAREEEWKRRNYKTMF